MPKTTSSFPCRHSMKTRNSISNEQEGNGMARNDPKSEKQKKDSTLKSVASPYFTQSYIKKRKQIKKETNIQSPKRKEPKIDSKPSKYSPSLIHLKDTEKDIPAIVKSILTSYLKANHVTSRKGTVMEPTTYMTKGNWCLYEGLIHVLSADPRLLPLVQKHGPPYFYLSSDSSTASQISTKISKELEIFPKQQQSFQPLCRIIVGQQLAGAAAKSIWSRFQATVQQYNKDKNCPEEWNSSTILDMTSNGNDVDKIEKQLRKPAGLSMAKVQSIIDLAKFFDRGDLSDELLFYNQASSSIESSLSSLEQIKSRLLQVKGIGPWSCDMFLLFHSQHPNILPIGDLGIRKGTTLFFEVKGKGKNGILCQKKDTDLMKQLHKSFEPYQSISSFYMWKCADTIDFSHDV